MLNHISFDRPESSITQGRVACDSVKVEDRLSCVAMSEDIVAGVDEESRNRDHVASSCSSPRDISSQIPCIEKSPSRPEGTRALATVDQKKQRVWARHNREVNLTHKTFCI
jgi:hypothetical protein